MWRHKVDQMTDWHTCAARRNKMCGLQKWNDAKLLTAPFEQITLFFGTPPRTWWDIQTAIRWINSLYGTPGKEGGRGLVLSLSFSVLQQQCVHVGQFPRAHLAGVATVVADRFASILPEVPHQRSVYSIHSQPHRMDRLQVCLIILELIVCDLPPSSFYYLFIICLLSVL